MNNSLFTKAATIITRTKWLYWAKWMGLYFIAIIPWKRESRVKETGSPRARGDTEDDRENGMEDNLSF